MAKPAQQKSATPARQLAHRVLVRVYRDGAYADLSLAAELDRHAPPEPERALATELVYGTLRNGPYIDFVLGRLVRGVHKLPPDVRTALQLGIQQLLFMRVPDHPAVNESVVLTKRRHKRLAGLVNATLRSVARHREAGTLPDPSRELDDPLLAMAVQGSVPPFLVCDLAATRGTEATVAWIEATASRAPLSLRVNRLRARRGQVAEALRRGGAAVTEPEGFEDGLLLSRSGNVTELPGFAEGHFTVQDLAASLVGYLAAPRRGAAVLDACAAPGGKATHLAELMQDSGTVVAVDLHPGRTRLIADNAKRLGLRSVTAAAADATDPKALATVLERCGVSTIDMAVVDAPCSGLGTLRRNPELRSLSESRVADLTVLQDRILDAVASLLPPSGVLVYAVCTPMQAEGPERVDAFLRRHPEFVVEPPRSERLIPFLDAQQGTLHTWTDLHGIDTFFAARLVKGSRPLSS